LIEHLQSQLMTDEIDYNNLTPEEIAEYRRQMMLEMNNQEGGNRQFYDFIRALKTDAQTEIEQRTNK